MRLRRILFIFKLCDLRAQRFILSSGFLGHGFHDLEFLAGDELAFGEEPLDLVADEGLEFAAHIHRGTGSTGHHFGHIFEET